MSRCVCQIIVYVYIWLCFCRSWCWPQSLLMNIYFGFGELCFFQWVTHGASDGCLYQFTATTTAAAPVPHPKCVSEFVCAMQVNESVFCEFAGCGCSFQILIMDFPLLCWTADEESKKGVRDSHSSFTRHYTISHIHKHSLVWCSWQHWLAIRSKHHMQSHTSHRRQMVPPFRCYLSNSNKRSSGPCLTFEILK